jgi:hypothetical protein
LTETEFAASSHRTHLARGPHQASLSVGGRRCPTPAPTQSDSQSTIFGLTTSGCST